MGKHNDSRAALAEFVKARLKALNEPPLREVATRLDGYSYAYLWNIVHGSGPRQPSDDLLKALANALNTSFEEVWLAVHGANLPPGLRVVTDPSGA